MKKLLVVLILGAISAYSFADRTNMITIKFEGSDTKVSNVSYSGAIVCNEKSYKFDGIKQDGDKFDIGVNGPFPAAGGTTCKIAKGGNPDNPDDTFFTIQYLTLNYTKNGRAHKCEFHQFIGLGKDGSGETNKLQSSFSGYELDCSADGSNTDTYKVNAGQTYFYGYDKGNITIKLK